jgi:hypothetical protein
MKITENMLSKITYTQDEIKGMLKVPRDFGYSGNNRDMFKTWTLGPIIQHRDSGLLEQSNAKAIQEYLESMPDLNDDWEITSCNHWGVGWVDHLSFRVLDKQGNITKVAKCIKAFNDALGDYPIADEDDYYDSHLHATLGNIEECGRQYLKEGVSGDWVERCWAWFSDNNTPAIEDDGQDQGGYPSDEEMRNCLEALGYLDDDYLSENEDK